MIFLLGWKEGISVKKVLYYNCWEKLDRKTWCHKMELFLDVFSRTELKAYKLAITL